MNARVKNILDGKGTRATAGGVFSFKTVIILIVLGAFSFSAYFVLAGFASDLRSTNNGGEHALSKSAIGFAGLVHILKENGQSVSITREPAYRRADKRKLKIVTVPVGFFPVALDEIEFKQPTLIVLPKWQTRPMPGHKGWVRKLNAPNKPIVPVGRISQKLTPITGEIEITRSNKDSERVHIQPANRDTDSAEYQIFNFENLQTIDGKNLLPIYITDQGPVLAQVKDSQTFILSDPDFMNTHSITKSTIAAFADNIVNRIQEKTGTRDVVFDLSLHGFTGSQNLIKLALTAPFLGATLALLAMVALIIWQAFMRFGEPARTRRPIAFGKRSLIETSSNFIEHAGRTHAFAQNYADLTRKQVLSDLAIPPSLPKAEQEKRLKSYAQRAGMKNNWDEIARAARAVRTNSDFLALAKTLYKWRGDMTHGRK